jgi:hypothetical protein
MRRTSLALLFGATLLTGCFHVTVISGTTPSPTVVDIPWQHSFVYGIVPPSALNVKDQCTNGVQKVETEASFLNGLVSALTWSMYTPIHVRVTCSAR